MNSQEKEWVEFPQSRFEAIKVPWYRLHVEFAWESEGRYEKRHFGFLLVRDAVRISSCFPFQLRFCSWFMSCRLGTGCLALGRWNSRGAGFA